LAAFCSSFNPTIQALEQNKIPALHLQKVQHLDTKTARIQMRKQKVSFAENITV